MIKDNFEKKSDIKRKIDTLRERKGKNKKEKQREEIEIVVKG